MQQPYQHECSLELTPFMEILDNITMPDFVHFHTKVLVLLFKVQNFKVNADKSECMKVNSIQINE